MMPIVTCQAEVSDFVRLNAQPDGRLFTKEERNIILRLVANDSLLGPSGRLQQHLRTEQSQPNAPNYQKKKAKSQVYKYKTPLAAYKGRFLRAFEQKGKVSDTKVSTTRFIWIAANRNKTSISVGFKHKAFIGDSGRYFGAIVQKGKVSGGTLSSGRKLSGVEFSALAKGNLYVETSQGVVKRKLREIKDKGFVKSKTYTRGWPIMQVRNGDQEAAMRHFRSAIDVGLKMAEKRRELRALKKQAKLSGR